jgi:hypothetical protein
MRRKREQIKLREGGATQDKVDRSRRVDTHGENTTILTRKSKS